MSSRKTNWDATTTLEAIKAKLTDEQIYQGNVEHSDSKQLRKARQTLQQLRKDAIANRNTHLHISQETKLLAGKLDHAKAIRSIQNKERRS